MKPTTRLLFYTGLALMLVVGVMAFSQAHAARGTVTHTNTVGQNNTIHNANYLELYTLLNAAPWLAQTTAPNVTNVFWIDTSGADPIIKYHNGTAWVAASSGVGGTYTLPAASINTLGGVKQGNGTSIAADGTISVTAAAIGLGAADSPVFTGVDLGVASNTIGLLKMYGNSKAYPFQIFSLGADAPGVGWRWPATIPSVTSLPTIDTNGYWDYLDPATFQNRVSGTCTAGSSIREIAANGTVTCETDDTGSGSVPSGTVNGQVLIWVTDQWVASTVPTWNQNTSGTAAGLSGTPPITVSTISAGAGGFAVNSDGDVTAKSVTVTRTTSPTSLRFYEGTGGGDNYIDLTLSGNLAGDSTVNLDALITTSSFDDTPDNGSTTTAPTANWAYDHAALAMSDAVVGHVESATTAETTTGTSTSLAVTPDGLSGSIYGQKEIGWIIKKTAEDTAIADGVDAIVIPASMNGMNLLDLTCSVANLNSAASGSTTVVLRRVRGATAVDMTSTGITINYDEYTASDETVDTSNDDVQTGDKIYADVNAVTSAVQKGLSCSAVLQTP